MGDLGASSADNPKGWSLSVPSLSGDVVALPSFDTLGDFSLFGAFSSSGTGVLAALLLVFSLLVLLGIRGLGRWGARHDR